MLLYTSVVSEVRSGHAIWAAGAVLVAALVVLARRLPGNSKPGSDLRPPDAQDDCVVNQHCQFCFRHVPCQPGALDLLKRLGCRRGSNSLRRTCRFRWRLVLPTAPPMSDPWTRPALRLAHGIQDAA
jgi:hypothetical protein